jgi:hypothetical protein
LPAINDEERGALLLRRAKDFLNRKQWSDAQRLLTDQLPTLRAPSLLGLRVQACALLGEAWLLDGKGAEAARAYESAASLWSDVAALSWIRSLPKGEASQRAVLDATNAAASARFQLAEFWSEQNAIPLPKFVAPQFETNVHEDGASPTAAERSRRTTERQRFQKAVEEYLRQRFVPWYQHQRAVLEVAQRKYEQVLLVPPAVPPYFRIAVAERIGNLWGGFARDARYVGPRRSERLPETTTWSCRSSEDEFTESFKQYARSAMDTCVNLSRKYRILSHHTLSCEHWLADHYASEHHRLDEWLPSPRWLPETPLKGEPPATLGRAQDARTNRLPTSVPSKTAPL